MILVLVETDGGAASEVSLETLALARSLSQAGGGIAQRPVLDLARAQRQHVGGGAGAAAQIGHHGLKVGHDPGLMIESKPYRNGSGSPIL